MLYRKSTSVLIVLVLVAICGSLCLSLAADGADDSKKERVTTVYSVEKTSPQTILPVLASIVPNAILTIEAKEKRLIVVATPADHETIVASLKSFEKVVDVTQLPSTGSRLFSKDEPRLTVYAIGEKTFRTLTAVLQIAVPDAMFSVGEDDKTLIAFAKPADHEKVCNTLRSLGKKPVDVTQMASTRTVDPFAKPDDVKDTLQVTVYTTGEMTAQTLMQVLSITAPEAQFMVGEDDKTLIVVAPPAEHEKICNAMRSLRKKPIDPNSNGIVANRVLSVGPASRAPATLPAVAQARSAYSSSRGRVRDSTGPGWTQTTTQGVPAQPRLANSSALRRREPVDPEMTKLEQADAEKGQGVAKIVEQHKAAAGKEQQAEVRSELKKAVIEHFAVRQSRRELEVARLEARLNKIRQSIAKRMELQEQIVDRHISELLGEADDLEF